MIDRTNDVASGQPESAPTVLIVEDDGRLATVFSAVLSARGFRTQLATTGRAALRWLASGEPSVVVLDLGLPDMGGLELLAAIKHRRPETRVVVLTVTDLPSSILDALRAGASGYLVKEDAGADLVSAIQEVLAGGVPLSRGAARAVALHLRSGAAARKSKVSVSETLTEREREVLQMLARGLTYDEVAQVMRISTNTVRSHVRALYDKLDAASRTEAIMVALERGLVNVNGNGAGSTSA